MTTPFLIEDLRRDEGLRLNAYPDPLTHGAPFTIGYGHTGPEVHMGLVWTLDHADAVLHEDVDKHCAEMDHRMEWWRRLDDCRQDVLANMAFNIGVDGLLGFRNTLSMVRLAQYRDAAANMLLSKWARQVGGRAKRLADLMASGERGLK
jgi:lysozyme